jgi:hypothetical protein
MTHTNDADNIQPIISEIKSLEHDLGEFKASIQKIKDAPKDKDAHVVGHEHAELIAELEDIATKLEELPEKWGAKAQD